MNLARDYWVEKVVVCETFIYTVPDKKINVLHYK